MNILNNDSEILSAVARQVVPIKAPQQEQGTEVAATPQKQWILPGFSGKSKVQTSFGNLPIEALRRRDQIRTIAGSYLEVEWVDRLRLDVGFLEKHPEAQPIYIPQNAFGFSYALPEHVCVTRTGDQTVGTDWHDGVHSALDLTARPNITRMPHAGFTYYLFHCGVPAIINVDGIWVRTSPKQ